MRCVMLQPSNFNLTSFVFISALCCSLSAIAEDFKEPMPPPEIGEELGSYRTRAQIIDEATRSEPLPNAQIRITPKYPAKQSTPQPQVAVTPTRKEEVVEAIYLQAREKIDIQEDALLKIAVVDGADVQWPIDSFSLSNPSFKVEHDLKSNTLQVKWASSKALLATLKIYLPQQSEPIEFVLNKKSGSDGKDYLRRFKISSKSPLNTNSEEVTLSNLKKTSKSRNSLREVEEKVQVQTVNTTPNITFNFGNGVKTIRRDFTPEEVQVVADILAEAAEQSSVNQ